MDQLLKVTTTPFQAIRFTQNARLLPADNIMLERHKALARHNAIKQSYRPGSSSIDLDYINQVNKAFSEKPSNVSNTVAAPPVQTRTGGSTSGAPAIPVSGHIAAPEALISEQPLPVKDTTVSDTVRQNVADLSEISSSYTVQRGSFELRVAKGELSYVPPLVMTIVTQYPDVEFEYVGGFNYFPSQEDSTEIMMNLTI